MGVRAVFGVRWWAGIWRHHTLKCLASVASAEITGDRLERAASRFAFSSSQPRLKKLCVCQAARTTTTSGT
jgi:hypothetical protein